jgi:hypothetical protein
VVIDQEAHHLKRQVLVDAFEQAQICMSGMNLDDDDKNCTTKLTLTICFALLVL